MNHIFTHDTKADKKDSRQVYHYSEKKKKLGGNVFLNFSNTVTMVRYLEP